MRAAGTKSTSGVGERRASGPIATLDVALRPAGSRSTSDVGKRQAQEPARNPELPRHGSADGAETSAGGHRRSAAGALARSHGARCRNVGIFIEWRPWLRRGLNGSGGRSGSRSGGRGRSRFGSRAWSCGGRRRRCHERLPARRAGDPIRVLDDLAAVLAPLGSERVRLSAVGASRGRTVDELAAVGTRVLEGGHGSLLSAEAA